MEDIENAVIKQLESMKAYVDLIIASRIIDSNEISKKALQGLLASPMKLTLEDAKRVGVDTLFVVMRASIMCCNLSGERCWATRTHYPCWSCKTWQ